MNTKYVHGYSDFENKRLSDQARTLSDLLHSDSVFSPGSHVLEIGCGTGAQTEIICQKNPKTNFTSVDISEDSLMAAAKRCKGLGIKNVNFLHADVYDLPFRPDTFDHIFLCFFLEHLPNPDLALQKMKKFVKRGGTLSIIEGDHGSAYFYPESNYAQAAINTLIHLQSAHGGNSLIGRSLFPLLKRNGFTNISVSPRMVYADSSIPAMVDGFTRKTFIAMVEGIKDQAIHNRFLSMDDWNKGIEDLYRSTEEDGVFCYTFFKAKATSE
jgi:ubiquinone/menaquinone biosynthesis C-methylase UbiE